MKRLLFGLLIMSNTNAFAAFNVFQCTTSDGKIQFTKSAPYHNYIEEKNLITGYSSGYTFDDVWPKKGLNGDIEAFTYRRNSGGEGYLCSLVISEDSPNGKEGTAVLYRINEGGLKNKIIERGMKCRIE